MKLELSAVAIVLFAGTPALAHRLDEYLQGTLISVEQHRVNAQMTLTPGVAVFPALIADIDLDANGVISETESRVYAAQVLHDLSISIDGHSLTPHLRSVQFPAIDEMKDGLGEIRIEFDADLPSGGPNRKLTFKNHHQSRIAAYQVNCLVSRDPDIRILGQNRNYTQSFYELDFEQARVRSSSLSFVSMPGAGLVLGMIALVLFALRSLLAKTARPTCRGV